MMKWSSRDLANLCACVHQENCIYQLWVLVLINRSACETWKETRVVVLRVQKYIIFVNLGAIGIINSWKIQHQRWLKVNGRGIFNLYFYSVMAVWWIRKRTSAFRSGALLILKKISSTNKRQWLRIFAWTTTARKYLILFLITTKLKWAENGPTRERLPPPFKAGIFADLRFSHSTLVGVWTLLLIKFQVKRWWMRLEYEFGVKF